MIKNKAWKRPLYKNIGGSNNKRYNWFFIRACPFFINNLICAHDRILSLCYLFNHQRRVQLIGDYVSFTTLCGHPQQEPTQKENKTKKGSVWNVHNKGIPIDLICFAITAWCQDKHLNRDLLFFCGKKDSYFVWYLNSETSWSCHDHIKLNLHPWYGFLFIYLRLLRDCWWSHHLANCEYSNWQHKNNVPAVKRINI